MSEEIVVILKKNGIDPNQQVNGRTAFQVLEGYVLNALEEIEDANN